MEAYCDDLKAAGIVFVDERGLRADFHALRHTCATRLAANGVPLPLAMAIMRHSDPKLTAKVYTDAGKLPLAEAVGNLPGLMEEPKGCTPKRTPKMVAEGRDLSQDVANVDLPEGHFPSENAEKVAEADENRENENGAPCRDRTYDPVIKSHLLYQLS